MNFGGNDIIGSNETISSRFGFMLESYGGQNLESLQEIQDHLLKGTAIDNKSLKYTFIVDVYKKNNNYANLFFERNNIMYKNEKTGNYVANRNYGNPTYAIKEENAENRHEGTVILYKFNDECAPLNKNNKYMFYVVEPNICSYENYDHFLNAVEDTANTIAKMFNNAFTQDIKILRISLFGNESTNCSKVMIDTKITRAKNINIRDKTPLIAFRIIRGFFDEIKNSKFGPTTIEFVNNKDPVTNQVQNDFYKEYLNYEKIPKQKGGQIDDDPYYAKYQKYKTKYLEIKSK